MMADKPLIVGLGGTTRPGSSSERLIRAVLKDAEDAGAATMLFCGPDLAKLPHYAPELPSRTQEQMALIEAARRADGIVIGTPGYHGGISGLVKNAIDLLEDLRDDARPYFEGRPVGLIVTAGGTNVAPAVLEERIRAHQLISHCLVVGDGRPYIGCLITLDPEELEHWKLQHGRPASARALDLATDSNLLADVQLAVDEANRAVSRAESVRRFRILPGDFTEAAGYLTPSDKVRRSVVARDFDAEIEALYA